MMIKLMHFFLALVISGMLTSVHAAPNWIRIGDSDFFYDKNSFSLNGEIVSFDVRVMGGGPGSGYGSMAIDCKRQILFSANQKIPTSSDPGLDDLAKIACKSWWQFWK